MKAPLFILLLAVIFLLACKKETAEPVSLHDNYFNMQAGYEYLYDLDSVIIVDEFNREDTVSYEVRDVIQNTFIDDAGRENYRVERFYREKGTENWIPQVVYTAHVNSSRAEVFIGNKTYIKMVFPVAENKKWDGNALNPDSPENYIYTNVHQPLHLGEIYFDSTTTVIHRDESDFLQVSRASEIYATNTGLIAVEEEEIETQQGKRFGYKLWMRLTSFQKL